MRNEHLAADQVAVVLVRLKGGTRRVGETLGRVIGGVAARPQRVGIVLLVRAVKLAVLAPLPMHDSNQQSCQQSVKRAHTAKLLSLLKSL